MHNGTVIAAKNVNALCDSTILLDCILMFGPLEFFLQRKLISVEMIHVDMLLNVSIKLFVVYQEYISTIFTALVVIMSSFSRSEMWPVSELHKHRRLKSENDIGCDLAYLLYGS